MKYIFLYITFSLLFLNHSIAENRDDKLKKLFDELKINNEESSYLIEQKIWEIWSTHPTNEKLTFRLAEGSSFVRSKKFSKAINIFTEVIEKDPSWAEAWNKRATVLYLLQDYEGSQKDIDEVLKLEQRHFGALAGQGLVNIELKNYEKAIKSYQQALEIYPTMKSPELMIEQIEALIKEELI